MEVLMKSNKRPINYVTGLAKCQLKWVLFLLSSPRRWSQMTKCLWPQQTAHSHYWTKTFAMKVKLLSPNSSHCQGWLGRQSGFLQIFFACHSCFIALWKEGRPTRSRSEFYLLRKLNERQKTPTKPLHRQKETFTSDWQHHKPILYPHKMSFRV